MASQIALNEILGIAKGYPKAKWLVVSADPAVADALGRAGAKMAAKPTQASGIVLVDTLHQLSSEELTTLAAFLHEGRPFIVSVPNSAHGSLRLAALANQEGNPAALDFDTVMTTLQSCGLNIADIAAVGADVLDSETGLDFADLPPQAFAWLRGRPGATDQRWIVLGVRTDSMDRMPLPSVRPLGGYVRPSPVDDARSVVSEKERQATGRAEEAERRVRELEAELDRLGEEIRSLREAGQAQRAEFAERIEEIRGEYEESARKTIEKRTQESNFARKAELKAAAKTERQLRAELGAARARIAELEEAAGEKRSAGSGRFDASPARVGKEVSAEARDGGAEVRIEEGRGDAKQTRATEAETAQDAAPEAASQTADAGSQGPASPRGREGSTAADGREETAGKEPGDNGEADHCALEDARAEPQPGAEPQRLDDPERIAGEAGSAGKAAEPAAGSGMARFAKASASEDGEPAESAMRTAAEAQAPVAETGADAAATTKAGGDASQGKADDPGAKPLPGAQARPGSEPHPSSSSSPEPMPSPSPEPSPEPERRSVFGRLFGRR